MFTIQATEPQLYKGVGGYEKQKVDLHAVDEAGGKKYIGYAKAEPVMNADGELVTWVWYHRAYVKLKPIFYKSLRQLTGAVGKAYNEQFKPALKAREDHSYAEAENFDSGDED